MCIAATLKQNESNRMEMEEEGVELEALMRLSRSALLPKRIVMKITLPLILFIILIKNAIAVNHSVNTTLGVAGVYMSVHDKLQQRLLTDLGLMMADEINAAVVPQQNGQSGKTKYEFTNFRMNSYIDVDKITMTSPSHDRAHFNFARILFLIVFDYKICHKTIFNICEHGWIEVFTLHANNDGHASLSADVDLSFKGSHASMKTGAVTFTHTQQGMEVFVQCTSSVCAIPVHDIAENVFDGFPKAVEAAATQALSQVASTVVSKMSTSVNVDDNELSVNLAGDWAFITSSLVIAMDGTVRPVHSSHAPPFKADYAVPDTLLATPVQPLVFYVTEYTIKSALWAAAANGIFDRVVTDADLPPGSAVRLNTSDAFWETVAPGLDAYPNCSITIHTSLKKLPTIVIEPVAQHKVSDWVMYANFTVSNATMKATNVFSLALQVGVQLSFNLTSLNKHEARLGTNATQYAVTATELSSEVGTVHTYVLSFAIATFLNWAQPTLPDVTVALPTAVDVNNVQLHAYEHVLAFGANVAPDAAPPSRQCTAKATVDALRPTTNSTRKRPSRQSRVSEKTKECAKINTCCVWSGSPGCCTASNAHCCAVGCCASNYFCCGTGCCPGGTTCHNNACYYNEEQGNTANATNAWRSSLPYIL